MSAPWHCPRLLLHCIVTLMEIAILISAVLLAGLACPAMMWWRYRRGQESACYVSGRRDGDDSGVEALRERQLELAERIAALDDGAGETVPIGRDEA